MFYFFEEFCYGILQYKVILDLNNLQRRIYQFLNNEFHIYAFFLLVMETKFAYNHQFADF